MLRALAVVVCALALGACSRSADPQATAPVESAMPVATSEPSQSAIALYALDCGRIHVGDADPFADDGSFAGQARDLVDPCYLIRHPKGDFLWDTGLPGALHDTPEGTDSGPFHLSVPTSLVDQLKQIELAPADIEYFALSHAHFDHVGNAALLTQATWIVDPDEFNWMFRDEARAAESFAAIAPLEQAKQIRIEGDGDYDVFGDGSVIIVQAPGHTPGHCVLLVHLPQSGAVLLSGDLWHLEGSRERRTVPRFNVDRAQTLASMDKVEALAQREHALLIRQHVPADREKLPAFPTPMN